MFCYSSQIGIISSIILCLSSFQKYLLFLDVESASAELRKRLALVSGNTFLGKFGTVSGIEAPLEGKVPRLGPQKG